VIKKGYMVFVQADVLVDGAEHRATRSDLPMVLSLLAAMATASFSHSNIHKINDSWDQLEYFIIHVSRTGRVMAIRQARSTQRRRRVR
jgi:hypothetical protein